MKRIHFILIFAITAIAALLLWQGFQIRERETTLLKESTRLTKSQTHAPRLAETAHIRTTKNPRLQGRSQNVKQFMSRMRDISNQTEWQSEDNLKALFHYLDENRDFLATTSRETNEKICEIIAASGSGNHMRSIHEYFLTLVADSDPTWAIDRMDQAFSGEGREYSIKGILASMRSRGMGGSSNLTPQYALALEKWLDVGQASGRLTGIDREVAAARFDIAMAMSDLATATRHFTQMKPADQSRVLPELAYAAKTPDERRGLIELASKSTTPPAFRELVKNLAKESGFEAARDALAHADLTPENRDLAAADTAGANIGPETLTRASWLLDSLQSDQKEPIKHFATAWAEGDYNGTVGWLNSLPQGANRDAAVSGFAPVAARLDGASAVDWALTIADSAQRETTLKIVAQTWQKQEPETAAAYLQEKGLGIK